MPLSVTIGGNHLRVEPTIRTLGMLIDKTLLCRQHNEHMVKVGELWCCYSNIGNVLQAINSFRIDYGIATQTHLAKAD